MKVLSIVGARPQFIKLAPLIRPLAQALESVLVHTGQHYDEAMSDQFFQELSLPKPHYHLGVGSGPHGAQTGQIMERLEATVLEEKPDVVLVFGDTNSTLAGALVAAKLHLPVAHVEAGLRSFNRRMPEEINRVVTDHLSKWLFTPSDTARWNLEREGIVEGVYTVGDIMVDALHDSLTRPSTVPIPEEPFLLLTVHRAENTDDPERLGAIFETLERHGERILFPCHPRTRNKLGRELGGRIQMMPPLGHRDTLELARRARLVLTDSGGLQKEAYLLETPCVTLRPETEWVETVDCGWNRLTDADPTRIAAALREMKAPPSHPDLYGDGQTARRILEILGKEEVTLS